jgi:hypothetical protein
VRTYKRKRPRQWRDKDKRMSLAARQRAEGKSTRRIAVELAVSHQTVMRDLARWDERHAALVQNVVQFPGPSRPKPGGNLDQEGGPVSGPAVTTGEVLGLSAREENIARAVAILTKRGA